MTNISALLKYIKYPLVTQKTIDLQRDYQFSFLVDRKLTKSELKLIFETLLKIKIVKITTSILPPCYKRKRGTIGRITRYKKACIFVSKTETLPQLFQVFETKNENFMS
jgi:ribosomal protein L23